jgi:hypothetical protein
VFDQAARPPRLFSVDYGRTRPGRVGHPPTREGRGFPVEGNAWIDRDGKARAGATLELGGRYAQGKSHSPGDANAVDADEAGGDGAGDRAELDVAGDDQAGHPALDEAPPAGIREGACPAAGEGAESAADQGSEVPPGWWSPG